MKKFLIILVAAFLLSACSKVTTNQSSEPVSIPPGMIYFYSSTCPHCANVATFMEQNNIKQKIFFVSKEVNSDKSAYEIAKLVGQKCGIKESNLGVPLFWDGTTCYLGEEEIINFFKTK